MSIYKNKLINSWDEFCSMDFSDLIEFVRSLLIDEKLSKKELSALLYISTSDLDKILYDDLPNVPLKTYLRIIALQTPDPHQRGKSKYDKVEKELNEKKNEFLDALNQCKPDSKYLQQLRELARTNAGNEKLCELIKYYTK